MTRQGGGPVARPRPIHSFDVSIAEARSLQEQLRSRVVVEDQLGPVRTVAGADVSYRRGSPHLYAAVVVLDLQSGAVVDHAGVRAPARFPYVPGLLSFRELPAVLEAFGSLRAPPDLVLADGHGRAHPRRFGLACHLGVWLDLPALGCAKSRLVGAHEEPGARRGSRAPLLDRGEWIGDVVRTRDHVRPVYVSVGHRISTETARSWVLRLCRGVRLPEPLRIAHAEVNRLRREAEE